MNKQIITDTGFLVALINKSEDYHDWAVQAANDLHLPFVTCEAVITETCFLLRDIYGGEDAVLGLMANQSLQIAFRLDEELQTVQAL